MPSFIIVPKIGYLGSFANLRVLEISLSTEGLGTQDHSIHLLMDTFTQSLSGTNLTKLSFSGIPRIDAQLLALIAKTFPRLTTMELTSTERADFDCCLPCLEDSLHSTRHSPIPDYYSTAEKLAVDPPLPYSFNLTETTYLLMLYRLHLQVLWHLWTNLKMSILEFTFRMHTFLKNTSLTRKTFVAEEEY